MYDAAIKNGITKEKYKFLDFDIKDNDEDYKIEKIDNMKDLMARYNNNMAKLGPTLDASGNVILIGD